LTMQGAERGRGSRVFPQDVQEYPARLIPRLGAGTPKSIEVVGALTPFSCPMVAFLCSVDTPGSTILKAFDQAAAWRDAGCCIISGFHSPLERQCLDILLRGQQPIVIVLARSMPALRLPPAQREALEAGRLTVLSPFTAGEARATAELARQRNRVVAALADRVVFGFVAPGGSLAGLRAELQAWGTPYTSLHGD
jgi:predicted Rossmann fold nucleotide-binding protein DprA/Smf involved in DNA uptake